MMEECVRCDGSGFLGGANAGLECPSCSFQFGPGFTTPEENAFTAEQRCDSRRAIAGASDTEPTNPIEAVTLGLTLALTAPTYEKAQACAAMAEDIAASAGLTDEQLEQCKDDACKHAFSDTEPGMDAIRLIRVEDIDELECVCGNTADSSGFDPCDAQGVPMEPLGSWDGLYVCAECGALSRIESE